MIVGLFIDDWLLALLCWLEKILKTLLALPILGLNAIVDGLATVIVALLALLPEMPEPPVLPAAFTTASGWVQWIFPVAAAVAFMGFALSAFLVWQAVAIGLRWAKAIDG